MFTAVHGRVRATNRARYQRHKPRNTVEHRNLVGLEEKLSQTAAAAFVITQEDIRRSGSTSIPELLRMVPGLSVAQIDANKWAVTSRGFNERFADKVLV